MASPRASLDKSPNKNWVENSGGLPPSVRARARALMKANPGWTLSRALAVAISQYKKEAATGSPKGAKVAGEWAALKAKNKTRVSKKRKKLTEMIQLAAGSRAPGASGSNQAFDESKYLRNPGNGKFSSKFTSTELIAGRRVVEGGITNLQIGQSFELPGESGWVMRTAQGFTIQGPAGIRLFVATLTEAVSAGASIIAGKIREVSKGITNPDLAAKTPVTKR